MINEDLSIEKKEKMEFKPLPEKIYQVEILDINLESRATYDTRLKPDNEKEYEKVLNFQFTLLNGKDGSESLRGRNIWENFVPTYLYIGKNGKNKLYRIFEAALGHNLTQEEEMTLGKDQLNDLMGKQIAVVIKNQVKGDKIYNRIESFVAVDDLLSPLTPDEKEKAAIKHKEEKEIKEKMDKIEEMPADFLNDIPFDEEAKK